MAQPLAPLSLRCCAGRACKLGPSFLLTPAVCFCLGWRDLADGLQQPVVVEPTDPLQCGQLDRLACLPRPTPMDQLSLVQPVDRLGRRVVVAVALAAHRGLDPRFCQPLLSAARCSGWTCTASHGRCDESAPRRGHFAAHTVLAPARPARSRCALTSSRASPRCAARTHHAIWSTWKAT